MERHGIEAQLGHERHKSFCLVRNREMRSMERVAIVRSEEHTSELQSLMRISYAVFCLKKKQTMTKRRMASFLLPIINLCLIQKHGEQVKHIARLRAIVEQQTRRRN